MCLPPAVDAPDSTEVHNDGHPPGQNTPPPGFSFANGGPTDAFAGDYLWILRFPRSHRVITEAGAAAAYLGTLKRIAILSHR